MGELVRETVPTVGSILAHQKGTACQFDATLVAGEALLVPGLVLEHDAV